MTKVYRDDITGKEYEEDVLSQFGIIAYDGLMDDFEVHDETIHNQPEEIADRMHQMVDEWLERHKEHLENEADYLNECHHCGYRWEYQGEAQRATCPSCGNKTPTLLGEKNSA